MGAVMPRDTPSGDLPPVTLRSLANDRLWVAWQAEDRGDNKPPAKVPYAPDGRKARADDPSTWGTHTEAEAQARKLPKPYDESGIGLEFTSDENGRSIGGIDLDTCRDKETGKIEPWAMEIIERFDTYTELSPSQRGVKLFFTYAADDLPTLRATMGIAKWGKQFKRGDGQHPPAIELHLGNRYFAVTNQHLPGTPVEFRDIPVESLLWVLKEAGPAFIKANKTETNSSSTDNSRSAKAFRKATLFKRAGKSFEEMCQALREDAKTSEWVREKGEANDGRELHRLWEHADDAADLASGFTEDEIASAFASKFKDRLRYCHDTGAWFEWNGSIWREEETHFAFHWARETCREAAQSHPRLKGILGKASTAAAV
jgi:putative DNA primase/helicase